MESKKSEWSSSCDYGWGDQGAEVQFEFPPRLRKTWRLIRSKGHWICQLPVSFQTAPPLVREDMRSWLHAVLHPSPGSRARKKSAQVRIFQWLTPISPELMPRARAQGITWDLEELFKKLNHQYFDGSIQAIVRWSPQIGGLSTHRHLHTATGSHHLLTISRGYDQSSVPREAVEGVLFHEMCHIAVPPKPSQGLRRQVHHKAFREAERRYEGYEAWRSWEARHLHKELRILKKSLWIGRK